MNFRKYSSIENTYRQKAIQQVYEYGYNGGEWEASNKIHGANFSVWYNRESDTIRFAKRSGFIKSDENFYNCNSIHERLECYSSKLANRFKYAKQIVMYGELFGGYYPDHKSNTKAVQKGVYYSPNLEFYVFDIMVDNNYLNTVERVSILQAEDIPYPKIFKIGTFEECLELPEVFEDPTYKDFGLDKVKINFSEGLVIKPVKPLFYPSGSRVILKKKNANEFSEKSAPKRKVATNPVSEDVQKEIDNILSFITEARLRNVISHIGEVTNKDFGKLMKEFTHDVIEDYRKDHSEVFDTLSKSDSKVINGALGKSSAALIRKNFLDIIDGTF